MLELPSTRDRGRPRTYTFRVRRRTFWLTLLGSPVLFGVIAVQLAGIDFRDQRSVYFRVKQAQASVSQLANDVKYLRTKVRATLDAEPESVVLDVKSDDWQRIVDKRAEALDRGLLIAEDDDEVPAKFGTAEGSMKAKIRLKGDLLDHLQHPERWSFRVKLRGDHAHHGMRRFSLQPPATRNHLHEWVLHRMVLDAGLIGLRYDFVRLSVNGNDLGIYALEEHFAKQVIESNARREGPIVKFEESTLWGVHQLDPEDAYRTAPISAFSLKSALDDPAARELASIAIARLDALRRGELALGDVFDVDATAHYFAICDLLGAHHGLSYNNLRFYHDPVSARLEPIAYDGIPGLTIPAPAEELANAATMENPSFLRIFFADPIFCAHYHRHLAAVSDPAFLEGFLDTWRYEMERLGTIIRSDAPQVRLDPEIYRENARTIARFLENGPDPDIHIATEPARLEVVNLRARATALVAVETDDGATTPFLPPVVVPAYRSGAIALPVEVPLPRHLPDGATVARVVTAPAGLETTHHRTVGTKPLPLHRDLSALPRVSTAASFPWLRIIEHDRGRVVLVPSGLHRLDATLVLGPEERLVIADGATLDLVAGAQVIAHGGITAPGVPEAPIVFTSSDGAGLGVFVTAAPEPSVFRHVRFENLDRPRSGAWSLTGSVTVHETTVRFEHCIFRGNRCEDALNVIRSRFEIIGCTFRDTHSDAFDSDFSDGLIADTVFLDSGNDAIDTSGSEVTVRGVSVRGAGDKGISAGEGSTLTASDLSIDGVEIAVASKDDSRVTASDLTIAAAHLDFAVYNKKPEYGPGVVDVRFSSAQGPMEPTYLLERASTLRLDGVEQPPNHGNVVDDLYGVKYGKSSHR